MVKRASSIIRFDGPALANHEMDVHQLAPALLALGDLCRIANDAVNSDISSVKVLVRADVEQKCFQLQMDLVQTLFERLTTLIEEDDIKSAKELLEWVGIIGGSAMGTAASLFGLYKFLSRKPKEDVVSVTHDNSLGMTTYVYGDNIQYVVPSEVDRIAQHPRALRNVRSLVAPLLEEGYETLEFERSGKPEVLFTKEEAKKIVELSETEISFDREGEIVSVFRASVKVRKAIMEGDAAWGINYRAAVDAKMIDREWLEDYQAGRIPLPPQSKLIVEMRETVFLNEDGIEIRKPTYEIIKVIGVELPPEQYGLL